MIVGAIVRTHDRWRLLKIVFSELLCYAELPEIDAVRISLVVDRGTPEVWKVVSRFSSRLWSVQDCPFPIISPYGERHAEAANLAIAALDEAECDWVFHADDDHWFEPIHIREELPALITNKDIDLWFARQIFFWDAPDRYIPYRERPHFSPQLFRFTPGDRYPTNRLIQATERIHDSAVLADRVGAMTTPLLDYSAIDKDERRRMARAYSAAGRDDGFTAPLLREIAFDQLRVFPADAVSDGLLLDPRWHDLYSERVLKWTESIPSA